MTYEIIGQVIFAMMMWLVGFMSGSYYEYKKSNKIKGVVK